MCEKLDIQFPISKIKPFVILKRNEESPPFAEQRKGDARKAERWQGDF